MKTNLDRYGKAYEIARDMRTAGLAEEFAFRAAEAGREYDGVFDLMLLWADAENDSEREEVIADLQESLDDIDETPERRVLPKMPYEKLEGVAKEVMDFKAALRAKVDQWGGVSKLANATGIPQPSLSRFFNTPSLPRRTTLYKIANAVGLSEDDVAFKHTP